MDKSVSKIICHFYFLEVCFKSTLMRKFGGQQVIPPTSYLFLLESFDCFGLCAAPSDDGVKFTCHTSTR